MKRLIIKWFDLVKWSAQFFLSTFLLILAYKIFMRGGDRGTIIGDLIVPCPLAIALGVILGDLSLYKGKKFIISAIPVAIAFSYIGLFGGAFFAEVMFNLDHPINVESIIGIAFFFGATTAPPIICYNSLTKSMRKYWLEEKAKEEKKEIDPNNQQQKITNS